jgi:hypothetical protein
MESVAEVWKPVKGFEGMYEVSDQGRVRALPYEMRHWCGRMIPKPGGLVTLTKHTGGYRFVALRGGKKHYVHRLVMAAFVGPAPHRNDVNHINGDKTDNRLCNLEYCNRLHNVRHAIATGLQDNAGEGNGMSKYTADQITKAHELVRQGASHAEAASATGVSRGMVQQVTKGTRWQCLNLPAIP